MTTMTLAELKEATLAEVARAKAEEDAIQKKKQAEEFDSNAVELKSQLEKHLPIQLIKEYGVDYRQSASSNAPVMAVINYRGAEICIWQSPASNWTHWDIDCKNVASHKSLASEDLRQVLLVNFIDAIDKTVDKYVVKVTVSVEVEAISPDLAIDTAIARVKQNAGPDVFMSPVNALVSRIDD